MPRRGARFVGEPSAPRRDAFSRSSVGVVAKTSRTVSLNWRMLANPAAKATWVNGRSVVSMSSRAVWARWARARAIGPGADLGHELAVEVALAVAEAPGEARGRRRGRRRRRR